MHIKKINDHDYLYESFREGKKIKSRYIGHSSGCKCKKGIKK